MTRGRTMINTELYVPYMYIHMVENVCSLFLDDPDKGLKLKCTCLIKLFTKLLLNKKHFMFRLFKAKAWFSMSLEGVLWRFNLYRMTGL